MNISVKIFTEKHQSLRKINKLCFLSRLGTVFVPSVYSDTLNINANTYNTEQEWNLKAKQEWREGA